MRLFLLVGVATCFMLTACNAGPSRVKSPHGAKAPVSAQAARSLAIYRGDGSTASWSDIVAAAAEADAVIVGENHGHRMGLASAAALWDDLLAKSPQAVLAMEFFERHEQADLSDYLTGVTDEAGLRKALKRDESSFPPGHQAMVKSAKDAGRPVIAANAPRRYVRLARSEGFDRLRTLTPEQQRLYAIPRVIPTGKYREDFEKVMNENAGIKPEQLADEKFAAERRASIDNTFRSQSVWDWTMSQSMVNGMSLGKPVLLVVGRFHCDHTGGLVQALKLQNNAARVVVVSYIDAAAPADGVLPQSDQGRADFVVFAGADGN